MFFVTTEWRANNWPGCAEKIQQAGLVFFKRSPTKIEVHKDILFGNTGKIMDTVDGDILAYQYCHDPRATTLKAPSC